MGQEQMPSLVNDSGVLIGAGSIPTEQPPEIFGAKGQPASHWRKEIAEWVFKQIATSEGNPEICLNALRFLADELGVDIDKISGGLNEKIRVVCSRLKTLNKRGFIAAAIIAGWDKERVALCEQAIRSSRLYLAS